MHSQNSPQPDMHFLGASVLREGVLRDESLSVAQGLISDPAPKDKAVVVDLTGFLVLPGLIDLHGDGFEQHTHPRPSAPFPMGKGLASYDQQAASSGITTLYLATGWSWEGGPRSPDQACVLMEALAEYRPQARCDLRVQLRVETHLPASAAQLLAAIDRFGVDYVVFNDHLAEGYDMAMNDPARFTHWARKINLTSEVLLERLLAARAQADAVPASLATLAAGFIARGVRFGSHDDPDAATRQRFAALGANVAEFPTTRAAADCARDQGDPVLMGAPNVVRGGSQSGNIAAADLVRARLCTGLVSDYHLPAMPLAAWALVDAGLCDLPTAWGLMSSGPAQVMGWTDRGTLAQGQRADLVILDPETRQIEATFVAGRAAHLSGRAAVRFMQATPA